MQVIDRRYVPQPRNMPRRKKKNGVSVQLSRAAMDGRETTCRLLLAKMLDGKSRRSDEQFERQLDALEDSFRLMRSIALTDELTGLYNRRGFLSAGAQLLQRLDGHQSQAAMFFFDVDNLKMVNDTLGHEAGDLLLVRTAKVLGQVFRHHDVIGRLSGDEFAALMPVSDQNYGGSVLQRLGAAVAASNSACSGSRLSLSVGSSRFDPKNPASIGELLKAADTAMYGRKLAKSQGLECA